MRPRTQKIIAGAMVLAVCLVLYGLTLAPTITWEHDGVDSGDLVAAAHTLGVAHPPGYPLFVILAKLFSLVPLGEAAFAANVMSALFGAGTAIVVFYTVLQLIPGRTQTLFAVLIASASGLSFALSETFWSQAVIAEVYTLNALLVAGAVLLATLYRTSPDRKLLWLLGLTLGLGLANHLSALLVLPGILYLILRRRSARPLDYVGLVGFFLLGLSAYLYLPLASARHPAIDWGACRTWSGFWWTVSARVYRDYVFAVPLVHLPGRMAAWLRMLTQQFTWLGFALGLVGVWQLWESDREYLTFTAMSFGAVVLYSLTYNTSDSYVYLIPSYLLFTLWIAGGARYVKDTALGSLAITKRRDGLTSPSRLEGLLGLSMMALPVILLASNFTRVSLNGDRRAYEYAAGVLAAAPSDAIIIADTDAHIFALWYVRYVETPEPAPLIVARGLFHYQWYKDSLRWHAPEIFIPRSQGDPYDQLFAFLDGNLSDRTIYLTDYDERLLVRYAHSQQGSLYKLGVKG